ncbi:hypothetical protein Godav_005842 [Gossypium davidsonii]|uniref:HD-ZIP protein N-terminal domain-containing protein n=2 Tax=Gossypium TaxID=3633 RepID=A0A7J8S1V5_GOSDV|nr:hypothetical protein [Gossypium davidsonii]MBA0655470.1 hypothetical protein [Gossypium klotzschianum]
MDPSEGLKRGLDVNPLTLVVATNVAEEKAIVSSPNSVVLMDFGIRNRTQNVKDNDSIVTLGCGVVTQDFKFEEFRLERQCHDIDLVVPQHPMMN